MPLPGLLGVQAKSGRVLRWWLFDNLWICSNTAVESNCKYQGWSLCSLWDEPQDRDKTQVFFRFLSFLLLTWISVSEDPSDEHSWSNFSQLQCTLRSFTSVIPPFKKRAGGHLDSLDSHLIAIHTFVHCCSINLEKNLIMTNADSLKTCLLAVDSITAIVQQLSEDEFIYVDVLLSVSFRLTHPDLHCWFSSHVGLPQLKHVCRWYHSPAWAAPISYRYISITS